MHNLLIEQRTVGQLSTNSSIQKIITTFPKETQLLPGHGEQTTIQDEYKFFVD